jgi:predicted Zn-dependent protease
MKNGAFLLWFVLLAACAAAPVVQRPEHLFSDPLFSALSERIATDDVFAVSGEMRRYLNTEIGEQLRTKGPQQGLIDALYNKSQLKVEYDSTKTRNAAQTFNERAGNCLPLTIDFLPLGETRGLHSWIITENTAIAMYMNNRAAEALARGQVDDAYWWTRNAIRQDPGFVSSYNALGVVYLRHGNLPEAEQVLTHALRREPDNAQVMSNLAAGLADQGRVAESKILTGTLEQK